MIRLIGRELIEQTEVSYLTLFCKLIITLFKELRSQYDNLVEIAMDMQETEDLNE
jgi:hypothetical protein